MNLTIEIPDDEAAIYQAKAMAQGLSLEAWVRKLAGSGASAAAALDWSQCAAVESVPEKAGGAWVFRATRMPVSVVFENLEDGLTIDELTRLYAGLTREQVQSVLEFAARSLSQPLQGQ
jgi:uncharacterized protein (DUF433 family)